MRKLESIECNEFPNSPSCRHSPRMSVLKSIDHFGAKKPANCIFLCTGTVSGGWGVCEGEEVKGFRRSTYFFVREKVKLLDIERPMYYVQIYDIPTTKNNDIFPPTIRLVCRV